MLHLLHVVDRLVACRSARACFCEFRMSDELGRNMVKVLIIADASSTTKGIHEGGIEYTAQRHSSGDE